MPIAARPCCCGSLLTGGRIKGRQIWPTGVRPTELGLAGGGADENGELTVVGAQLAGAEAAGVAKSEAAPIGHHNLPARRERDTLAQSGLGPQGEDFVRLLRVCPVQWERTRTRGNTGPPPAGPSRSAFDMPRG